MPQQNTSHVWRFFRAGGFDQVRLDRGSDLAALDALDQKLWVALSCPTRGLEFDERTLDLLDADHDGHIRAAEVIAAAKWASALLKDPDLLVRGAAPLPLAAIDDGNVEGRNVIAAARRILASVGKRDADAIACEDTGNTQKIFAETPFNGDAIVPVDAAEDAATQAALQAILDCLGAETDRSAQPGVSQAKAEQFFNEARAYCDWWEKAEHDPAVLLLNAATASAADALHAVRAKLDDYFTRCRLAAYQADAAAHLAPAEPAYQALAAQELTPGNAALVAFPLAAIAAGKPAPLGNECDGINPAWAAAMARLRDEVVIPLLGKRDALSEADWQALRARFAAFEAHLAGKPTTQVEKLGIVKLRAALAQQAAVMRLIERDKALADEMNAVAAVEKLVRYTRHLHVLVNNFVSFRDFYTHRDKAVFQAGTLYLDGRSCELCVKVTDPDKHATIATLSRLYLVYCACTRGTEKMTIAAAFTAGDADQLMVGRNAVFYDRKGQDWDATIVKLVEHPISIRQAFWSPYKRIGKMVSEQLQKVAASRAKAIEEKAAKAAVDGVQKTEAAKTTAQSFDAGKFAGIFAAIGLAIGAIGTAIASMVTGLLGLKAWQLPIALAGMMMLVSGPSMAIAWFKLRERNLGPILDANGWAVNARARINIPFGTALTAVAKLPEGAERSLTDPYAEKETPWGLYLFVAAMLAAVLLLWRLGYIRKWMG